MDVRFNLPGLDTINSYSQSSWDCQGLTTSAHWGSAKPSKEIIEKQMNKEIKEPTGGRIRALGQQHG